MANCNGLSIVHFTPPDAGFFREEVFGSFFLTLGGDARWFQHGDLRFSRKNLSSDKINPGIFLWTQSETTNVRKLPSFEQHDFRKLLSMGSFFGWLWGENR